MGADQKPCSYTAFYFSSIKIYYKTIIKSTKQKKNRPRRSGSSHNKTAVTIHT